MINVDIHSTVLTATFIAAVAALLLLIFGTKGVIKSRKIPSLPNGTRLDTRLAFIALGDFIDSGGFGDLQVL